MTLFFTATLSVLPKMTSVEGVAMPAQPRFKRKITADMGAGDADAGVGAGEGGGTGAGDADAGAGVGAGEGGGTGAMPPPPPKPPSDGAARVYTAPLVCATLGHTPQTKLEVIYPDLEALARNALDNGELHQAPMTTQAALVAVLAERIAANLLPAIRSELAKKKQLAAVRMPPMRRGSMDPSVFTSVSTGRGAPSLTALQLAYAEMHAKGLITKARLDELMAE